MKNKVRTVTVSAPVNLALVKYWGKSNKELNLPMNSSLSVTLNQEHLRTITKVTTCPSYEEDEVWLNGVKQHITPNGRLSTVLSEIRQLGRKRLIEDECCVAEDVVAFSQKVQVHSENNFPTAAGLASSASGYAALVFALGKLFDIPGDLTTVARRGSGSACRSLHGGFVEWQKGNREDGKDSIGVQVFPQTHWPEFHILVLVVNSDRKKVGSTEGMQRSADTSDLLQYRAKNLVEKQMRATREAIAEKDFSKLAEIIMRESNQLHSICLDTFPPLHYLNDISRNIMNLVHAYNASAGSIKVAYSFDAGPNACLFTTEDTVNEFASVLAHYFQIDGESSEMFRGKPLPILPLSQDIQSKMNIDKYESNLINYIVHTTVGDGPQVIDMKDRTA